MNGICQEIQRSRCRRLYSAGIDVMLSASAIRYCVELYEKAHERNSMHKLSSRVQLDCISKNPCFLTVNFRIANPERKEQGGKPSYSCPPDAPQLQIDGSLLDAHPYRPSECHSPNKTLNNIAARQMTKATMARSIHRGIPSLGGWVVAGRVLFTVFPD